MRIRFGLSLMRALQILLLTAGVGVIPADKQQDLRTLRPYTASSAWNQPIGPNPRYDPYSERMVATIGEARNGGVLTSDPNQYSYPVYYADAETPRYNVSCRKYKCTLYTPQGAVRTTMLPQVPIPSGARPSAGSDSSLIVIDLTNGDEYNLWQIEPTAEGGWSASNGSRYNLFWDGMPTEYGSRGAGLPYQAGLIRPHEIERGYIDHALAFAYPTPARKRCVYPASKTDGRGEDRYHLPEGARLQLDPRLTEADFERWGLDRTGKIIARAMQKYGVFLIDISGRPKLIVENLADNPFATRQWSEPGILLSAETVSPIPYTALRVLALPASYWDTSLDPLWHGQCHR